jgi:hypothetical protein
MIFKNVIFKFWNKEERKKLFHFSTFIHLVRIMLFTKIKYNHAEKKLKITKFTNFGENKQKS